MSYSMIDRYFIKSFISTCIFVGTLLGLIAGLSFFSGWAAWFFLASFLLFWAWFYRLGSRLMNFTANLLFLPLKVGRSFIMLLEKLRLVGQ